MIWVARSLTGTSKLKTIPNASPGSVNASGSSLVSASVNINPSNRYPSTTLFNIARFRPKCA